jgi:hypothetical protein
MTPEEHIAKAELLMEMVYDKEDHAGFQDNFLRCRAAELHVLIASHKKQHPPESGRPLRSREAVNSALPVRSSGRMHNHVNTHFCKVDCPAHETDSTNYQRSISDNPQA